MQPNSHNRKNILLYTPVWKYQGNRMPDFVQKVHFFHCLDAIRLLFKIVVLLK